MIFLLAVICYASFSLILVYPKEMTRRELENKVEKSNTQPKSIMTNRKPEYLQDEREISDQRIELFIDEREQGVKSVTRSLMKTQTIPESDGDKTTQSSVDPQTEETNYDNPIVYIWSRWRSGSSFLGDLLSSFNNQTFYR